MKVPRITIVTSRDYYGLLLENKFEETQGVSVVFNSSERLARIFGLLQRHSLSTRFLVKAMVCRLRDFRVLPGRTSLRNELSLREYLRVSSTEVVIMFRMGIIVSGETLKNWTVVNVHVAKLPDYAGLGSILKALDAKDYCQLATAHRAVEKFDAGSKVLAIPYRLSPQLSYCQNERNAYLTGIKVVEALVNRFQRQVSGFE